MIINIILIGDDSIRYVKESKCGDKSKKGPRKPSKDMDSSREYDKVSAQGQLLNVEIKISQTQKDVNVCTKKLIEAMEELKQLKSCRSGEAKITEKEFTGNEIITINSRISRSQSREF